MSVPVRKAYVETARGQLHYRHCGEGTPLVLLQLLPFGSLMFEPVMPAFAGRGYACYAFDLMGYGRSDKRSFEWLVRDFSENLLDAFDRLDVEPGFVVGGHFTALIALDLAHRVPERVRKVVLDGIPVWSANEREERFSKNPPPAPVAEDGSTVGGTWRQTVGMLKRLDPDAELTLATESGFLDAFVAFVEATYKPGTARAFFEFATDEKLASLRQPALVVGSPTDTLADYHDRALELIPDATEHRFESTHPLYRMTQAGPPDGSQAYVDAVDAFLRS